jgi:hypothetical protein
LAVDPTAPGALAPSGYQLAPGLLVHDWGETAAAVFVPATASTHLIDGSTAAWLAEVATDEAAAALMAEGALADQIPALLLAGILVPRAAA